MAALAQTDPRHSRLRCALAGAAAGLVNGFFGGGGGMIFIPLLTRWIGVEERRAFATCVCVILPLCIASGAVYLGRAGIDLALAWPYLAGGLLGGIISGLVFQKVPTKFLRRLLALLIIYGGVRSLFWP